MLSLKYNQDIFWQISEKQGESVWCDLKRGNWPKELYPVPPEYQEMDDQTKEQLRQSIMRFIESEVGKKAVLRQWKLEQHEVKDRSFDDWWDSQVRLDLEQCMNLVDECSDNIKKVLRQNTKEKRDERHNNRNLILRSVSSFLVGMILAAFFEAFGLGALLFGFLLCLLSALSVYFI